MTYELAHRPHMESSAELATGDAQSSWAAVEQLRQRIPAENVILSARPLS
ncbi:hypothetical protein [Clavibacter michiganensis]|nr:hypothetical protein [Clavibacter michiganensis]